MQVTRLKLADGKPPKLNHDPSLNHQAFTALYEGQLVVADAGESKVSGPFFDARSRIRHGVSDSYMLRRMRAGN